MTMYKVELSARGLNWAVGLSRRQNVYLAGTELIFPEASKGRRRKYHIPDRMAVAADTMLEDETWQKINWRQGTKGRLGCQFAAARVRIADGHKHRMGDGRVQAMPGDEEVCQSVSGARPENRNTTFPIYRKTPRSRRSPPLSKPDGSANRRISNSRKNSDLTISRGAPGPGCTDTR